ncbi:lipoprotein YmcC precursor [Shewanella sp. BC20]|uniref:YjbF family lipoprotein n=1 Tax=Shewanella sp. BC20 TaxID=2004459 RepID=UPI000D65DF32|nr:YjbF family lipoprotein [Shewanella sp. BC20]PWF63907.1 lipoprotein YmcC precursor [Shewanella sp. BC20]
MRIYKTIFPLIAFSAVCIGLSGCSQRISALNDTVELAFFGNKDVELTPEQVSAVPYASIYAKIEDTPQAFMVLGFAEDKVNLSSAASEPNALELKWLSADKGMLITVNGRLVRTYNLLTGNLAALESSKPDPLLLGLHLDSTPKTWTRTIDWQPGYHYGYEVRSEFNLIAEGNIQVNGTSTQTLHYIENVSVESLNIKYQNEFWLDPHDGKVIKSRQKIAPNLPFIDITLLRPFAA